MPTLPAQPNQSLISGLECLYHVAGGEEPIGSRELARQLGLEPTRVNRLLKTLAALGFVRQDTSRRYVAGSGIHVLSALSLRGSRLLSCALPELLALEQTTGHPAAMGVVWQQHVCYLYHGGTDKPLADAIGGHAIYPIVSSSIGKAVLASQPAEEQRLTATKAGLSPESLQRELVESARRGYALDHPDSPGSVAVAIGEPAMAGVALMHVKRHKMDAMIPLLRETAARITAALGKTASAMLIREKTFGTPDIPYHTME